MKWKSIQQLAGFTLVELLVVIAIIGILLGILIPVLSKVRERGRTAVCQSNIRQLCAAWVAYALDHDGEMISPPWYDPSGKQRSLKDYLKGSTVVLCPSGSGGQVSSYAINDYLNWGQGVEIPQAHQVSKISKPSETFVFIEAADAGGAVFSIPIDPSGQAMGWQAKPGYWHDGTSIAFVDGHAEYFKYLDPRTRDLWKQGSNYLAQPDNQDAIRIAAMEHPQ